MNRTLKEKIKDVFARKDCVDVVVTPHLKTEKRMCWIGTKKPNREKVELEVKVFSIEVNIASWNLRKTIEMFYYNKLVNLFNSRNSGRVDYMSHLREQRWFRSEHNFYKRILEYLTKEKYLLEVDKVIQNAIENNKLKQRKEIRDKELEENKKQLKNIVGKPIQIKHKYKKR